MVPVWRIWESEASDISILMLGSGANKMGIRRMGLCTGIIRKIDYRYVYMDLIEM